MTMDPVHIGVRGEAVGGAFGVGEEGALPARSDARTPAGVDNVRPKRSLLGKAVRIMRDAAIAVALMASIPIIIVATQGERAWGTGNFAINSRARMLTAEKLRPLVLPKDPAITPMQAGLAYHRIQGPAMEAHAIDNLAAGFAERRIERRPEAIWERKMSSPGMFKSAPSNLYDGPDSRTILQAVAKGFSAEEMTYLRTLATDPVWQDFTIVARAPAADFVGGRFNIPFGENATSDNMPIPSFKATRGMANAAVSRAAFHLAEGRKDSAEAVLRAVISYGFTMIDNGTSLIEQLIGNVVVGTGREGLRQFYEVTGDPRVTDPNLASLKNSITPPTTRGSIRSVDEVRSMFIARIADPTLTRGERYETLRMLSGSSCTNVRELLLGPRKDVTDAFENARRSLARYPSEVAVIDMYARPLTSDLRARSTNPLEALAVSAGAVAGAVLNNPHLPLCSRIMSNPNR